MGVGDGVAAGRADFGGDGVGGGLVGIAADFRVAADVVDDDCPADGDHRAGGLVRRPDRDPHGLRDDAAGIDVEAQGRAEDVDVGAERDLGADLLVRVVVPAAGGERAVAHMSSRLRPAQLVPETEDIAVPALRMAAAAGRNRDAVIGLTPASLATSVSRILPDMVRRRSMAAHITRISAIKLILTALPTDC